MIAIYLSLIDENDMSRFEKIYYKYKNLLFYIANGILPDITDAEDAVQEAFIRIAKNMDKIEDTESVATAALSLEDIGEGELTLAGDFAGTFGEDNDKFGSFYFAAFSEQSLDLSDEGPFLGRLLQCYYPGLMMIPAEEEESAPAMLKRATKVSNVPLTLKKQKRFK